MFKMPKSIYSKTKTLYTKQITEDEKNAKNSKGLKDTGNKINISFEIPNVSTFKEIDSSDFTDLSQRKLQEAIVWSEILGKPMCKRRERR